MKSFLHGALAIIVSVLFLSMQNCSRPQDKGQILSDSKASEPREITVYTHRHYESDQMLFNRFTEETGIKVNVVNASADELILKMENEGEQSPADVLITVDAGRLERAKLKGLLQAVSSQSIESNIPSHLRDSENYWFGLTKRARVIAYAKDRVKAETLTGYQALAEPKWKGKILVRSSGNIYNQSLLAAIIANEGVEAAKAWAASVSANMARRPKGNDRDQMKAVVAGEGDVAVVNTYYLGKLLTSSDPSEVEVGEKIGIYFPDQTGHGTHVNVSGAGVAKYAPNKAAAIRFIEFLSGPEAQSVFSSSNFEYPVNPSVEPSELLKSWGTFKEDQLPLSMLGKFNKQAVIVFDEVGWQ